MNHYRYLCTGLAFALIFSSGITATTALAVPLSLQEVKQLQKIKKTLTHKQRVQVRASEEKRIAQSQEKSYKKQMQALEKYNVQILRYSIPSDSFDSLRHSDTKATNR